MVGIGLFLFGSVLCGAAKVKASRQRNTKIATDFYFYVIEYDYANYLKSYRWYWSCWYFFDGKLSISYSVILLFSHIFFFFL